MKKYKTYKNINDLSKSIGVSNEDAEFIAFRTKLVKKIISERKKQGLTQKELAKLLKTKQSHISRIENGALIDVSIAYLLKVLASLNVEVSIKTLFKKVA